MWQARRMPGPRRRGATAAVVVALAAVAVACGTTGAAPGITSQGGPPAAALPSVPVQVTIAPDARQAPVPRSFLGLSTEYWALPLWNASMPLLERVMSLVHVAGSGPLILRVGGDSADHSFWDPHGQTLPPWAFTLAPRWLAQARRLVRDLRLKLILDLNLITDDPPTAAQWARAAEAGLPRSTITAFEVGNEPDIYSRPDWLAITAGRSLAAAPGIGRRLPARLTAQDYVRDFQANARALAQVAPHVTLGGPALANPVMHARWVSILIHRTAPALGLVTIHRYPYSGCLGRRYSRSYATIPRLLSSAATTGMATALRPVVDTAHDAGLPVRLTELNSVNCGGRPGVSDAFATALWAPDALFSLLRAGVDGVNLHVRADAINAAFALGPGGLQARPLLYGLMLFARTLGPQARLVRLAARPARPVNFAAWAVRVGPDTLHVLLIDKGRRSLRVSLRVPATADGHVQRLLAASVAATGGVTLGGRSLAASGQWQGPLRTQSVTVRHDSYTVDVRHGSAALFSVRVRPGTLGARVAVSARRSRAGGRAPRARSARRR